MVSPKFILGVGGAGLLIVLFSYVFLPLLFESSYDSGITNTGQDSKVVPGEEIKVVTHLPTPENLRAIYMTACVASMPNWRSDLKSLIESTELNSVVIDVKDYTGNVSFVEGSSCYISDLQDFISTLHQSGIYVIGRISVFQDPAYAKLHPELAVQSKSGGVWKDRKGLAFIDVGAKPYWDYILNISHRAYALGFDELNFDYVRYPSDGNMEDTKYTWTVGTSTGSTSSPLSKPEMLETFFSYLHDNLEGVVPVISVDLFGMTTTVASDMGIGQVLERALPYFDYIAPMVYPSHYPPGWNGFKDPALHPYEVIKLTMSEAKRREELWYLSRGIASSTQSKLRPWLQDFSLGVTYGPEEVRAQIQATYDASLSSWMLWSAGNRYTASALLPETAPLRAGQ